MADILPVIPHIKHVAHTAPHAVVAAFSGVSYMTAAICAGVSAIISFGLGWYVKGRGFTGVKTDVSNAVTKVEDLTHKPA